MNRSRIASVLLACLLVTAGVAGPMSQPAAAASGDTCSGLDAVIYDVMTWQNIAEDPDNPCSTQYQVDAAIEDMEQSDANQTHTDVLSAANSLSAQEETWGTTYDNYLNDTQSVAWMKMQVAVAEAYENGATEIQARQAGIDAINDYYATKQKNLIEQWNVSVHEADRLRNITENEGGLAANIVRVDDNGNADGGIKNDSQQGIYTVQKTTTLVDGNTTGVTGFGATFSVSSYNYDFVWIPAGVFDSGTLEGYNQGRHDHTDFHVLAVPPDSNYEEREFLHTYEFHQRWNQIETYNNNLETEVENFVNATYSDFDSGTINASDVISANTAMFEYGTSDSGSDGNLYRSVGALSMMGFDTPHLNGTGTMTVTYDNQQYDGLLMAESAPNGSWSSNTTYNTSNIDGPVFLVTTGGEKVDFAEGKEFRINEIRNEDGTSADSVNTTQYAYKTANTSEFVTMQEELSALRAEIEEREPDSGAGGGSGGMNPNTMLIVLAVAAAVAIGLGSQNGGGRRGRRR